MTTQLKSIAMVFALTLAAPTLLVPGTFDEDLVPVPGNVGGYENGLD